jgi:AcrR family transcriptional regulator
MPRSERGERRATLQGDETRRHILATALKLFREHGFDETTMRDVAKAAGMSLGAAYYYFPSKEAIVTGYYDSLITEHRDRVRAAIAGGVGAKRSESEAAPAVAMDLRARLGASLHAKIDMVQGDRALLGALFRFIGNPEHTLSPLGPATRAQRDVSMSTIDEVLGDAALAPEVRALVVRAIWSLQMGALLFFLYDTSPGLSRTRRLIDSSLDITCQAIALASHPASALLLAPVASLLHEAGLLPRDTEEESTRTREAGRHAD